VSGKNETVELLQTAVEMTPAMNGVTVKAARFSGKVTVTVTAAYLGNLRAVQVGVRDRLVKNFGVAPGAADTMLRGVEWVER
jgi:hypothetical protein